MVDGDLVPIKLPIPTIFPHMQMNWKLFNETGGCSLISNGPGRVQELIQQTNWIITGLDFGSFWKSLLMALSEESLAMASPPKGTVFVVALRRERALPSSLLGRQTTSHLPRAPAPRGEACVHGCLC